VRRKIVKSVATSIALRILLGLAAFALLFLVFYVYHEGGWRDILSFYRYFFDTRRLRVFIASFGPFAALVFVAIQVLQVLIAPIPGEITGFVGGFLFGTLKGMAYSTIGLTAGSLIAFWITRRFGMRYVEKIVKKHYIDKFNDFITHKGLYVAYVLFLIPGFPKDSLCYLLGLTHIRFADFLFMNLFGRLPGTLILTLQGTAVKEQHYKEFFIFFIASMALTFVLYLLRNHIIHIFGAVTHRLRKKKEKK
jgi:uncharacterized membrane protein YdjX (TVP38/TMEM64 family)